jgi:hypothetical protein
MPLFPIERRDGIRVDDPKRWIDSLPTCDFPAEPRNIDAGATSVHCVEGKCEWHLAEIRCVHPTACDGQGRCIHPAADPVAIAGLKPGPLT